MLPFYPFYWADYSGKTMHLTQGQHGAYTLFLRFIYTTGRRIPHQQRYSIAQAMLEHDQQNADFVLGEFFKRKGDEWSNEKADEVIADAHRRHQAYVDAGKAGSKRRYNKAGSDATATQEKRSSNYNHNQKEKAPTSARSPSGAPPSPPTQAEIDAAMEKSAARRKRGLIPPAAEPVVDMRAARVAAETAPQLVIVPPAPETAAGVAFPELPAFLKRTA